MQIVISGQAGEGRSAMAQVITEALRVHGFEVVSDHPVRDQDELIAALSGLKSNPIVLLDEQTQKQ